MLFRSQYEALMESESVALSFQDDALHEIAEIAGLEELNIGHAIVAHAIFVGWDNAVIEMKALMKEAAPK